MRALSIPYPPSANRLWRNVPGRGTLKARAYRVWLAEAQALLRAQRPQALSGSYKLRIVATRPDNRARDIDNLIKPISDVLKLAGVIKDDSLAKLVSAEWSDAEPAKPGTVQVTLEAV